MTSNNKNKRMTRTAEQDELRREELRGAFMLGLLVILWQYRDDFRRSADQGNPFAVILFSSLYVLTACWGAYVFLMILGWSQDMAWKSVCGTLRSLARLFLVSSIVMMLVLTVGILVIVYPNAIIPFGITVLVIMIYYAKVPTFTKPHWKDMQRTLIEWALAFGLGISLSALFIMSFTKEPVEKWLFALFGIVAVSSVAVAKVLIKKGMIEW
jgi:hypothetical protein